MGAGGTAFKSLFYFLNIIFWLSGAGFFGIGIWLLVDQSTFSNVVSFITEVDGFDFETDSLDIIAYMFIAVGAVVFVVGFCGCMGAVRDVSCLMGLYIFFLVLVLVAEIAVGVFAVIYRENLMDRVQKNGRNYIIRSYNHSSEADYGLDFIQYNWECCGVTGHKDYIGSPYNTTHPVSQYCCKMQDDYEFDERNTAILDQGACNAQAAICIGEPNCHTTQPIHVHHKGCLSAIEDWISDHLPIFIGVGIGIGLFELVIIISAILVCRQMLGSSRKV